MTELIAVARERRTLPDAKITWAVGSAAPSLREPIRIAEEAGSPIVEVTFDADPQLTTFGAFTALLESLLPLLHSSHPRLLADYREVLGVVARPLFPSKRVDPFLSTDTIVFAITRRISRESVYIAPLIDDAGRFLIEALRSPGRPVRLVCAGAEHLDRPSARIFHRAIQLREEGDQVSWIWHFGHDPLLGNGTHAALDDRLTTARRRLFQRLAADLRPRIERLGTETEENPVPSPAASREGAKNVYGLALRQIARDLVYQNYEHAYNTAAEALGQVEERDERAHLHRLIGIADANTGQIEAALESMDRASAVAAEPTLMAHLEYLKGLLLTKRHYALAAAAAAYARGLAYLEVSDAPQPETAIEQAWLLNGQALLDTLVAKLQPPEQRAALFERSMGQLLKSFNLVADKGDASSLYLRFNLLGNMAFLLEITQQYDQAIEFWRRAFEPHVDAPGYQQSFGTAYYYRLGALSWKAGQIATAVMAFERASALAREGGDRFLGERIAYGLGYAHLLAGALDEAIAAFSAGASMALDLRDWPAFLQHAGGMIVATAKQGTPEEMGRWLDMAGEIAGTMGNEAIPRRTIDMLEYAIKHDRDAARTLDTYLVPPAPKLPSYIPAIDLEMTPAVDLNAYLASTAPAPSLEFGASGAPSLSRDGG